MTVYYYDTFTKKHYPVEVSEKQAKAHSLKHRQVVSKEYAIEVLQRNRQPVKRTE